MRTHKYLYVHLHTYAQQWVFLALLTGRQDCVLQTPENYSQWVTGFLQCSWSGQGWQALAFRTKVACCLLLLLQDGDGFPRLTSIADVMTRSHLSWTQINKTLSQRILFLSQENAITRNSWLVPYFWFVSKNYVNCCFLYHCVFLDCFLIFNLSTHNALNIC